MIIKKHILKKKKEKRIKTKGNVQSIFHVKKLKNKKIKKEQSFLLFTTGTATKNLKLKKVCPKRGTFYLSPSKKIELGNKMITGDQDIKAVCLV